MKKIIYLSLILCMFLTACGPSIKTARLTTEQSDEKAMRVTDNWVAKDTELAVQAILEQIQNHKGFQNYLLKIKKKPKIFISEIQNQTAEAYFPIGEINDELLNAFSNSGEYILIESTGREQILKEIKYQNDGMVDSLQAKSIGKMFGTDLIIFGAIRMKPEMLNGKTVKDYSVNIRMTNIETGEEVLRTRYKISKFSQRKGASW